MAKDKKEKEVEKQKAPLSEMDIAESIINKKHGSGFVTSVESLIDEPPEIISISPKMDLLLNDGITSSSWINIIGPAKWGKTTLALRMATQAQKQGYFILYANVEHRLKQMNLLGTAGLDISKTKFKKIESTLEETLTGEKYVNIIEDYLKNTTKIMCIIDSVSSFAAPSQIEGGAGTATMGRMGAIVSQFINNICAPVSKRGHIIVNIQQCYNNVSGWGKKKFASGGSRVVYQGDCILEATKRSELKSGEKIIGQEVEWTCECSARGTIPFSKASSYIRYGIGIDCELELVSMAKEVGLFQGTEKGSWLTYGETKLQGIDNWAMKLKEDRPLYDKIYKEVMALHKEARDEV